MVTLRKQLIKDTRMKFAGTNPGNWLTIHETANTSRTATAAAHANLQSRQWEGATWHITVDDKEAVQSYDYGLRLWHAGDGQGHGNMSSIAIEACVNAGSDKNKMRQNLVEVSAMVIVEKNIPRHQIVQHNYWSGKNCPTIIRRDGAWNSLVNRIWAEAERLRGKKPAPAPKPAPKPKPFDGDAKAFIGQTIKIGGWWNYKTASAAESMKGGIRIMPAGDYRVSHVSGKTPHLVKTDNLASGWVHSSVLDGLKPAPKPAPKLKQIKLLTEWWNYRTAADAKAMKNWVKKMPAGTYEITKMSNGQPHLRNVNGKHSGWVNSQVL